jgi:4-hydroxy-3-methylbut-2-enyl diphosphate reductase
MARSFDVPEFYRSPLVSAVKAARRLTDPRKRDRSASLLDFGPIRFRLARHFGFCYGVENAVDLAYRAIEANEGRRIFLLSEMIHNQHVNEDLLARGVRFLRTTAGEQIIPFDELTPDDVVIVPAFGATLEIQAELADREIDVETWDTTCPFVEKVWKRSAQIGATDHTVVVHGKWHHEETRATFSHARKSAPVVVVRDLEEATRLAQIIRGDVGSSEFGTWFGDRCTEGFDPSVDLGRIGVVNQTTMLASETAAIATLLRDAMVARYGAASIGDHFSDTSDTLCYATNENQDATTALIGEGADLAIVVGGYNSSNTSHLVELCEEKMPTYFVRDETELLAPDRIRHFDYPRKILLETTDWLPGHRPLDILLTAGASCPDVLLDRVIRRILSWESGCRTIEEVLEPFLASESPADSTP